ncbi:Uncharacterised protein [Enterobacter cloacae]|nr:Uncharacterised protein [Enterobacter cloacae]
MLLKNPLLLVSAQQADILVATLNHHLGKFIHGGDVINPDIHINRIGTHCTHFHHRDRGVFQPVAYGIGVLDAEQYRRGDIRGQQRFEQFLFLFKTMLRFRQHDLVSGWLEHLL